MTDLNDEELRRIELMHEMLTSEESDNKNGGVINPMEEILTPTPIKQQINENKMAYELVDSLEEKLEKALSLEEELKEFQIGNSFVITDNKALKMTSSTEEYCIYCYTVNSINDDVVTFNNPSIGTFKIKKNELIDLKQYFKLIKLENGVHYVLCSQKVTEDTILTRLVRFNTMNPQRRATINAVYNVNHSKKTYHQISLGTSYFSFYNYNEINFISLEEHDNIIEHYALETAYSRFYKNETFVKNREIFEAILNDLYPDLWFYKEYYNENAGINTISPDSRLISYFIQFPKIEISNSSGNKHTIYDLFIVFDIRTDFRTTHTKPYGCRLSMSLDEIEVGYMHSHLPVNRASHFYNYSTPNVFCVGDGQPISIPCAKIAIKFDEDAWLSLLMQLPSFLSWESLEGVPHIHMKNVGKKEGSYRNLGYSPNRNYNLNHTTISQQTKYKLYDKNILKQFKYVVVKDKITNLDKINVLPESIIEADKRLSLLNKVFYNDGVFYYKETGSNRYAEHVLRCQLNFRDYNTRQNGKVGISQFNNTYQGLKNSKHESTELYFRLLEGGDEKEYDLVPSPIELAAIQAHINNIIN